MALNSNQTPNWDKAQKVAVEAALQARTILLNYLGHLQHVEEKHQAGLVSEADKESEKIIQTHLKKHFPEFEFLGEEMSFENPGQAEKLSQAEGLWIVDPLDGTTNYIHQFPIFCISIGLQYKGELQVAVIDVPVLKETYTAIRGQGAFLNGQKISVSPTKTLKDSLIATGFFAENEPCLDEQLRIFSELIRKTRGVRRPGAAVYDLCMVAKGVFDMFWERNLKPWDTAAGALLVREAGGVVTTYKGEHFNPFHNAVVASNANLSKLFLEVIGKHISTNAD